MVKFRWRKIFFRQIMRGCSEVGGVCTPQIADEIVIRPVGPIIGQKYDLGARSHFSDRLLLVRIASWRW